MVAQRAGRVARRDEFAIGRPELWADRDVVDEPTSGGLTRCGNGQSSERIDEQPVDLLGLPAAGESLVEVAGDNERLRLVGEDVR